MQHSSSSTCFQTPLWSWHWVLQAKWMKISLNFKNCHFIFFHESFHIFHLGLTTWIRLLSGTPAWLFALLLWTRSFLSCLSHRTRKFKLGTERNQQTFWGCYFVYRTVPDTDLFTLTLNYIWTMKLFLKTTAQCSLRKSEAGKLFHCLIVWKKEKRSEVVEVCSGMKPSGYIPLGVRFSKELSFATTSIEVGCS